MLLTLIVLFIAKTLLSRVEDMERCLLCQGYSAGACCGETGLGDRAAKVSILGKKHHVMTGRLSKYMIHLIWTLHNICYSYRANHQTALLVLLI
jgi:hypothetical protein